MTMIYDDDDDDDSNNNNNLCLLYGTLEGSESIRPFLI